MDFGLANRVAFVTNGWCEAGRTVAATLAGEGAQAVLVDPAPGEDGVRALIERHGRCDIAVAVLPPLPEGPLESERVDAALSGVWNHVTETAALFKAALPSMQANGWGRCLFVGPIEAKTLTAREADLERIVGLAILGMQKALSGEIGHDGVTCNSVLWTCESEETRDERLTALAATVGYLSSPLADFITGVTIAVDGAATPGTF